MRRWDRQGLARLVVGVSLVAACGSKSPEVASPGRADIATAPAAAVDESGYAGGGSGDTTATTLAPMGGERGDRSSFYLAASDQAGDGRSVTVDEVTLAEVPGWVAVHSSLNGSLGPVIGWSEHKLVPGTHRNVTAVLAHPPVASVATVYLMVHLDTDGNDTFDYPGADGPASLPAGGTVMVPVRLRIP